MSTPAKTIHPFYNNIFSCSGNVDQSLFAYITNPRPNHSTTAVSSLESSSIISKSSKRIFKGEDDDGYDTLNDERSVDGYDSTSWTNSIISPNLVTSIGSTIYVYSIPDLQLLQTYTTYGNINSIQVLHHVGEVDALLISFAGYPRFSIIQIQHNVLQSICLFDLTSVLQKHSGGYSITNLYEEDSIVTVGRNGGFDDGKRINTGVAILAGGVVMVIFDIERTVIEIENENDGSITVVRKYSILDNYHVLDWSFEHKKQHIITSQQQQQQQQHNQQQTNNKNKSQQQQSNQNNMQNLISNSTILSPYGEILDIIFLTEYNTPTIAILHVPKRSYVGQIHKNSWKKYSSCVTALSINTCANACSGSLNNSNMVELWNVSTLPWDTKCIKSIGSTIGIIVAICPNGITLISNYGQRIIFLCVNGFSHTSFNYSKFNESYKDCSVIVNDPLLSITLDGMRMIYIKSSQSLPENNNNTNVFVKTALCILHNGDMYALHIQINSYTNYVQCMKLRKLPFVYEPGIVSTLCTWKNLLFLGSVYGDSILFQLRLLLQIKDDDDDDDDDDNDDDDDDDGINSMKDNVKNEDDGQEQVNKEILMSDIEREEMELYDGYTTTEEKSYTSEEENDGTLLLSKSKQILHQHKFTANIHIILLTQISYIVGLGPLGKSCYGLLPLLSSSNTNTLSTTTLSSSSSLNNNQQQSLLYPCGYGKSGGIAIFEKDNNLSNNIIYETDLRSIIYTSSISNCLILHRNVYDGGQIILRQIYDTASDDDDVNDGSMNKKSVNKISWVECNISFPIKKDDDDVSMNNDEDDDKSSDDDNNNDTKDNNDDDVETIWKNSNLLLLHEYTTSFYDDEQNKMINITFWITFIHYIKRNKYYIMTFSYNDNNNNNNISFYSCQEYKNEHPSSSSSSGVSIIKTTKTPINYKNCVVFGCINNDGYGTIIIIRYNPKQDKQQNNNMNIQSIPLVNYDSISAIDIFLAPKDLWEVDELNNQEQEDDDINIDDDDASISSIVNSITNNTNQNIISSPTITTSNNNIVEDEEYDNNDYFNENNDVNEIVYDQDDYELYNLSSSTLFNPNKRYKKSTTTVGINRVKQSSSSSNHQDQQQQDQPLSSPISISYSSYSITQDRLYVAICTKKSHVLSIVQLDFNEDNYNANADDNMFTVQFAKNPVWYTYGCGFGYNNYPIMTNPLKNKSTKSEKDTENGSDNEEDDDDDDYDSLNAKATVQEISFFYCTNYITTSSSSKKQNLSSVSSSSLKSKVIKTKTFHFLLLTSNYDVQYYTLYPSSSSSSIPSSIQINNNNLFIRCSIGNKITRKSLECSKYYMKLVRRNIVNSSNTNNDKLFQYGLLHKFDNINGRSGCFVNVSRPLWFYSQREIFYHTMKHASPNGILGNSHQGVLTGFTSIEYLNGCHGFVTLHERLGRVGSQRLTLYSSVAPDLQKSAYNQSLTKITNSGYKISKIPLGVTVRQIAFLNSISLSTPAHPLYVLLISRIVEEDNPFYTYNDSLSPEERKQIEEKKEEEKMKRQVEADLGGFDLEQEWVEEIERDDCFVVNKDLGGIPKLKKEKHEIWLMDSSRLGDTGGVVGGEQNNDDDDDDYNDENDFGDWKLLDKYELKEYEHGMVLRVMNLSEVAESASMSATTAVDNDNDDSSSSEMKYFITVGTGVLDQDGEDVSSKGRVLFLEVLQNTYFKVKEQDQQLHVQKKLSLVYEKDIFLGPVTALSCLETDGKNRLVVGAGAEVTVEQWGVDGKLTQVGFFHANMQIQDINIFKTFLLLADAYDSLHFLVWRESDKSLTLLAKDYEPTAVYASGLLCRGSAMYFLCHDDRQNFQFFNYAPHDEASRGGNKLVCKSDFHLGVQTISFDAHYCRNSLLVHSSTANSTMTALKQHDTLFGRADDDIRFGVHFGTGDGGFGCITPVNEQIYWRLTALQSVMSNALENNCGLSHRAWRLYRRSARRSGCRGNDRKRGVLDGTILFRFLDLNLIQQEELASAIGSTVNLIMDNLLELECASMV